MIFSNLNNLSVIIFILILLLWWYFTYKIYSKNNNFFSWFFLFVSLFFISINIFEIKWWLKSKIENIEWWKIVFVLDVSKSMNSNDWIDNNKITRLELWKKLISTYISKNLNNNYWLIIFSWEAIEILPFTNDLSLFNTILFSINNSNISKNWTNLNSVFDSLNNYFSDDEWWLVVLISDWWDDEIIISNNALNTIEKKWLIVNIVWIASEEGWKIPIWKDMYWKILYKNYQWNDVITKLNNIEFTRISKKYKFNYNQFINFDNYDQIDDFITKNINLLNMKQNIDYRYDFTRLFIFISFTFFILFLLFDNFTWRKKELFYFFY